MSYNFGLLLLFLQLVDGPDRLVEVLAHLVLDSILVVGELPIVGLRSHEHFVDFPVVDAE